jgi:hypothetical protein
VGENEWKSGVPVVVLSVNLPPTLGQPVFQIPQIRRFLDPCGSALASRMRASSSLPSASQHISNGSRRSNSDATEQQLE